jgi:hypothetical protein
MATIIGAANSASAFSFRFSHGATINARRESAQVISNFSNKTGIARQEH